MQVLHTHFVLKSCRIAESLQLVGLAGDRQELGLLLNPVLDRGQQQTKYVGTDVIAGHRMVQRKRPSAFLSTLS